MVPERPTMSPTSSFLSSLNISPRPVPLGIALQAACPILNMEKDDLSEGAQGNYAPGKALYGFLLPLKLFGTEAGQKTC